MEMLLRLFTDRISNRFADQMHAHLQDVLEIAGVQVRRITLGTILILISTPLWFTALLFVLLALFFNIANLYTLVPSSLWTAAMSALIALLLSLLGVGVLRRR